VADALAVVRGFVRRAGLGRDEAERLAIVVEEWIANVVEHGAPPPGSRIALRLERAHGLLRVTISDAGQAFDPRTAAFGGPNLDRGGGAGLELMRAWSHIAAYRRRGGRNRLVLEIPLA
jgi:anti-sigma regulatory factor (Ser/Thr protein kinase)